MTYGQGEALFTTERARGLSLAKIRGLTEDEAALEYERIRWADTDGWPACPKCGGQAIYRYQVRRIYKCKSCKTQFSATSGTPFASRKLTYVELLRAVALFADKTRNQSGLQLSRDLGVQYRTAADLTHKLYSAIGSPIRSLREIPRVQFAYPFVQSHRSEAHDLLRVNRLVPRHLPEWVRADIGQSIMLRVIEGVVTPDELERSPGLLRKFIRAFYKEQAPWEEITGFGGEDDDRAYEDIAGFIRRGHDIDDQSAARSALNAIPRFHPATQIEEVYAKQVARRRDVRRIRELRDQLLAEIARKEQVLEGVDMAIDLLRSRA